MIVQPPLIAVVCLKVSRTKSNYKNNFNRIFWLSRISFLLFYCLKIARVLVVFVQFFTDPPKYRMPQNSHFLLKTQNLSCNKEVLISCEDIEYTNSLTCSFYCFIFSIHSWQTNMCYHSNCRCCLSCCHPLDDQPMTTCVFCLLRIFIWLFFCLFFSLFISFLFISFIFWFYLIFTLILSSLCLCFYFFFFFN